MNWTIRSYRAGDRERVREICFRTGFMGDPVDRLWADAESFADLWVAWYTDNEPQSAWVVDVDGEVAGYLVGCEETRNGPNLVRIALRSALTRALPVRPGTAGFIWRAVADIVRDRTFRAPSVDLDRWPAHLHIDLLPGARGLGAGTLLVQTWLERLRDRGIPGVHLGTMEENTGAIAFFEAMGFRRHGDVVPIPGNRAPDGGRVHAITMVREIDLQ